MCRRWTPPSGRPPSTAWLGRGSLPSCLVRQLGYGRLGTRLAKASGELGQIVGSAGDQLAQQRRRKRVALMIGAALGSALWWLLAWKLRYQLDVYAMQFPVCLSFMAMLFAFAAEAGERTPDFTELLNSRPFSDYVIWMSNAAMSGQGAVICGLRSPEWGQIYHDRLLAELRHHIATPTEQPRPGSREEADQAFEVIAKGEEQTRAAVTASSADCTWFVQPGNLVYLDDRGKGTLPFWPGLMPEFARRGGVPEFLQQGH